MSQLYLGDKSWVGDQIAELSLTDEVGGAGHFSKKSSRGKEKQENALSGEF